MVVCRRPRAAACEERARGAAVSRKGEIRPGAVDGSGHASMVVCG